MNLRALWASRPARTFAQAFVSSLAVSLAAFPAGEPITTDIAAAFAISAIAAALSKGMAAIDTARTPDGAQ